MTPKYQDYPFCRKELQYAGDLRKPIIPCLLTPDWLQSDWLGFLTAGLIWLDFRDVSDDNIEQKLQRMIDFIHILTQDAFKRNIVTPMISQEQKTIHMILMGRAGSGKSSLGNTILGEKQFDLHVSSHSAVNDKCKVGFRHFYRQHANLIVIDTPGFFKNEKDIEGSVRLAVNNGICAVLLTLSIDFGLTNQEEKMIDTLTDMYGDKIFRHMIIVFTGLDKIDEDLSTFIDQQCSSTLKKFLERCGNRYIAIDNNANATDKDEFVSKLIDIIMAISHSISHGSNLSTLVNSYIME
ncbi:unnamed protein product [Rotaria sordida]|uniref:AIG1-type G domain-containing protein n=1 Tax=Rotaria sordida TaxID=392033 RepID=A0A818L247_9BILA|nr:unnamed protein product [Rotaria sordida]